MLVVIDTNVFVSGLLNGSGRPGRILDLMLDGLIQIAYDDRILAEYEDVLFQPEFDFNQADIRAVINYIELAGCFCYQKPFIDEKMIDQNDLPFLQVLVSSEAEALITGNIRHFPMSSVQGKPIYSPARFLSRYFP